MVKYLLYLFRYLVCTPFHSPYIRPSYIHILSFSNPQSDVVQLTNLAVDSEVFLRALLGYSAPNFHRQPQPPTACPQLHKHTPRMSLLVTILYPVDPTLHPQRRLARLKPGLQPTIHIPAPPANVSDRTHHSRRPASEGL